MPAIEIKNGVIAVDNSKVMENITEEMIQFVGMKREIQRLSNEWWADFLLGVNLHGIAVGYVNTGTLTSTGGNTGFPGMLDLNDAKADEDGIYENGDYEELLVGDNRPTVGNVVSYLPAEQWIAFRNSLESYIGVPYVFGGSTPSGFDCSGYVIYCLVESGVMPGMARVDAQSIYTRYCYRVNSENIKAGDLLFLRGTYETSKTITHVAVYDGQGGVYEAAGNAVRHANLNTRRNNEHFYAFGRLNTSR